MANLTEKELSGLEDQLSMEQNLIKKYQTYAAMSNDPQITRQCQQIAGKHQSHFDTLKNFLN